MTLNLFRRGAHPAFEALSEYSAGELTAERRLLVERHLNSCARCAAELTRLQRVLDMARDLPGAIEPPADLWEEVRDSITSPSLPRRRSEGVRPLLRSPAFLAAAALLLVASSSALTALVMRERQMTQRSGSDTATSVIQADVLPASLARVDAEYARTAAQLELALASQRARLAPRTIETLERSLRTIDTAIAEARRALAQDPGNRALVDIFSANYQQKLDLMKRVTELSSSI